MALFTQAAADEGVAADELAAASWVRERFWLDADTTLADDVAAVRDGSIADAIDAALARGIDGRDRDGGRIVVAARRIGGGFGEIAQGLDFAGATWAPASTSNYQSGSRGVADIDHIVIHDTEGSFAGSVSWFQDPTAQVSAHYIVRSSDGHIDQMVAEKDIAWHDKCFNTNTVGVEHEGFEAHPELWYTEAMYEASARLTSYLADKYNIAKQHGPILGHGEAPDCSDHTDPGPGWNWDHYIELVQAGGAGEYLAGDITVDAPATLESGTVATVTVTVANHGTSAWDLDATRVGTAEPQDRVSELFVDGDWIAPNRAAAVDAQTPAGGIGTFTFQ
ncbi:MAG TPA: peptidoglycan recognition family protein, partial [Kofleriaceae bacterium]